MQLKDNEIVDSGSCSVTVIYRVAAIYRAVLYSFDCKLKMVKRCVTTQITATHDYHGNRRALSLEEARKQT